MVEILQLAFKDNAQEANEEVHEKKEADFGDK
jgi:hypothetical protein